MPRHVRLFAPWILILTILPPLAGCATSREKAMGVMYPTVRSALEPDALMDTVRALASPEFDGRLPGSEGYDRASVYVRDRFRDLRLLPVLDRDYYQRLLVEYNDLSGGCGLGLVDADGTVRSLELGVDHVCRGFSGSGTFTAPVVFAGYGLSFPGEGYDDYAGIDVAGKVVLVFKGGPAWAAQREGWFDATLPRPKAKTARSHGALGMLMVSEPDSRRGRGPIASVLHGVGTHDPVFPQLHVSPEIATELLTGSGMTLEKLQEAIDEAEAPKSISLSASVAVDVRAEYHLEAPTQNVLAVLPGADPELRDEYVLVGAHLDHVGRQSAEVHFPGAHDNASGTAAVLAVAAALVRQENPPARSVIFALFAAEEQGLFGARHLAAFLPVDAEQVVAMINLDCVGRGEGINLGSGEAYPRLHELARRIDQRTDRRVVGDTWYGGGADATPFYELGIPTIYFHTRGGYDDIHSVHDTPDTLDPHLLAAAARLAYGTAREIAAGRYDREARAPREGPAQ